MIIFNYIVYTTKTSSTSNSVCTQKWIYGINDDDDGLKQGDRWSEVLFNLALEYGVSKVHTNQEGLKLHGTHPHLMLIHKVKTKM
jgi:hypothetical protein